jgi:1-acyl-sn-glycerol-3-phosphate acyltransferase
VLRAAIVLLLLVVNVGFWGTPILALGLVKLFIRRRGVILALAWLGERWVATNDRIFDALVPTQWDVDGVEGLHYDRHYLILSNHLSWVDIVVLQRVFHGHVAFLRFFLKRMLIWMPIIGQACWALEFPFMRRSTPEYLEKHPEKRGKDLETTRRACRRYRNIPVTILNFIEGTRFSREKHADEESPYRHLLRPRVGGISFVLASLGDQLDAVLDATIAYPRHDATFYEFISGRIPQIVVRVRRIDVPPEFETAAVTEPGPVRERFKVWLEERWREKDALLDELLGSPGSQSAEARRSAPE